MATSSTRESENNEPGAGELAPRRHGSARRVLSIVVLAAGILLAVVLLRVVGWPSIAANLERVGARFLLLIGLYTAAQAAFAIGWWLVIEPRLPAFRLPTLFSIYLAGDSLNYLAPGGIAGEPVKARLLGKRAGTDSALASLAVHKQVDLLAQWLFMASGVAYAIFRFPMPAGARAAAVAGAVFVGALLLFFSWAIRRGTYGPILRALARWKLLAARLDRYHRSAEIVDARIRVFSAAHPRRYFGAVAMCFLGWCGGMLETYLILRFLSPAAASWGTALAVEALAMALNNMFLFVPGKVGGAEGVRAGVFLLLGMSAAQGVAYGLVRRGRELTWALPGLVVLFKEHAVSLARRGEQDLSKARGYPDLSERPCPAPNPLAGEESRP